ncbi:GRAM domain [Dillenia turbinata]|uniref:GRAM domain n=1 Tax=Dillenia turbinata TaxID=194707 RepID=A0AAN8ZEE6_9MAGN
MKNNTSQQVIGIPICSAAYLLPNRSCGKYLPQFPAQYQLDFPCPKQNKSNSVINRMGKIGRKADKFVREHEMLLVGDEAVKLAPKISETVKGKLSLGAKILQRGGVEKVFKETFSGGVQGERLMKASQCCLFTTAGPIAGLLFISSHRIAFCSHKSIKITSPDGQLLHRFHYKVMIPIRKINRAYQSVNVAKPSQKYIQVATVDDYEFWFTGFLNCRKTFNYLQDAIARFSTLQQEL